MTAAALAGFVSCKSDKKPDDGTKDVPVGSDYPEYLTGKTYGGDTVHFLVASECLYDFTLSEDDEGDDAISAAALKRNQLVSEYHNVRLEFIDGGGINEFNPKMLGVVQAGDPTYDIFCPPYWWNTGNEGVAANLSEISVFDFSQPWWYRYINDELVYPSGNMYYCTGAIDNIDLSSVGVTFVNKTIFADACGDLNVLFEKAKAGEWTKDLALEYAQKFGSDIDANGVMDENDAYGIIVGNGTNSFPRGASSCRIQRTTTERMSSISSITALSRSIWRSMPSTTILTSDTPPTGLTGRTRRSATTACCLRWRR